MEKNETLKIRVDPDDLDTKQIQCFEDYQPYEVQRTLNVIQKYRENYEKKEIRKEGNVKESKEPIIPLWILFYCCTRIFVLSEYHF